MGVSTFKDLRDASPSVLGRRTIRNYMNNDLVVQGTVADVATAAFKNALRARGVAVKDLPAWDLTQATVSGEGIDILVGGEVRTLWVDVVSQPLNVKQKAEVSLRISAASMPAKTVFKTLIMNSKTEKKDAIFSWDSVESQLSESLTAAIEQFLKDEEFKKRIQ